MDHTITLKTSHLLFVARLLQIILSVATIAFAITLTVWSPDDYYYDEYDYYAPEFLLVPIIAIGLVMLLTGYIGMFAYKRPNDVHWHMMLSLDWLTFVGALANGVMAILTVFWGEDGTLPLFILLIVTTWTTLSAILVPIIRTHRLAKKKLLPPPNSRKQTWYHMEDEARSPYATYPVPPPQEPIEQQQQQQQRGNLSRADTTARWSGNSAAETNASVVPPYYSSAGFGSGNVRGSMYKETLASVEDVEERK